MMRAVFFGLVACFLAGVSAQGRQPGICAINLGIVVDKSGSIVVDQVPENYNNWIAVQRFVLEITRLLNVGPQETWVGIVLFGNEAQVEVNMEFIEDNPLSALEEKIRNLPYPTNSNTGRFLGENTNTQAGLELASDELFNQRVVSRAQTRDILLIITDGKATRDGIKNRNLIGTADAIKRRGIQIIGVGVTDQISERELKDLVSDENTDYIEIDDFDMLQNFLEQTITAVCTPPTTTPAPVICDNCCELTCDTFPGLPCYTECPTPCIGLVTCPFVIPVRLADGHCGNPEECEVTKCVEVCRIDLLLIVDESGSILQDKGQDYWTSDVRPFVLEIIDAVNVGFLESHVGMITFGDTAKVQFRMDAYNTSEALKDAVPRRSDLTGGNTNLAAALRQAHRILGNDEAGDRPDVLNMAVIITDGEDTIETGLMQAEAALLQEESRLIAVGVTREVNRERLIGILRSEDDYFEVDEFEDLAQILASLISRTCNKCNDTCPAVTPDEHVLAFHAYTTEMEMQATTGAIIPFEQMYTNFGNGYDPTSGVYTCPCTGMYMFLFTYSDVDCEFGTVIKMDGRTISAIAHVSHHGAMTTHALTYCGQGQQVYVEVVDSEKPTMDIQLMGNSLISFSGHMIYAME